MRLGRLGDDWWSDPGFSAPIPEPPPIAIDDWWNDPAPPVVTPAPPARDDWWQDSEQRPAPPPAATTYPTTAYHQADRGSEALVWFTPPPADIVADDAVARYLDQSGGDAGQAVIKIQQARRMGDTDELRNAEHALASQHIIDTLGPVGYVAVAVVPPVYSAAKWIAQNVPGGDALAALSPVPLTAAQGASAPSFSEVWWGWRPLWAPLR